MATVYLVSGGPFTKIGYTTGQLKKRMEAFAVGNPFHLQVRKTLETEKPKEIEKALHAYFRDYRVRGEWYDLSDHHIYCIGQAFKNHLQWLHDHR
jgi:hypothetical protein